MSIEAIKPRTIPKKHLPLVKVFMEAAAFNGPFLCDPVTLDMNPHIGIWTTDGKDVPALAIFQDDLGNWTLLNADTLKVEQYLFEEVC